MYRFRKSFTIIHNLLYSFSAQKKVIQEDLNKWRKEYYLDNSYSLSDVLIKYPAFRNVYYYRLKKDNNKLIKVLVFFAKLMLKKQLLLFITTRDIGGGLFFLHGFSTIVSAKSIGMNCWINQQVTIGYTTPDGAPVIGDNVKIFAGAKVLGDIKIGNNVIIGANAVVVKDVPEDCTVVGVPARIVRIKGKRVNQEL